MIDEEEKQRLVLRLNEKFAQNGLVCPMCHHNHFSLADGYVNNFMQDNFNGAVIGGTSIPAIPIICTNCGFISMHAIGVLGMLPNNVNNGGNENV